MSSHGQAGGVGGGNGGGNPNPDPGNPNPDLPVQTPDPVTGKGAAGGANGKNVAADAQAIGDSMRFTSKNPPFDIASLARFKRDESEPEKVFTEQKTRFEEPVSHIIDKTPQVPRFTQDKPKIVFTAPRF